MRVVVAVCLLALVACSSQRKHDVPCAAGQDECMAAAGGSGGANVFGSGGAGGGPSGSGGATAIDAGVMRTPDSGLRVHVEDDKAMRVEIVTLQCAGDCVDVEAVARGGHPPYSFEWEDGSRAAKRHMCLDATATLHVSATDTAIASDEFDEYAAQTVKTELMISVLDCTNVDAGMPGQPCDYQAEAGSFDPVIKWSWDEGGSLTTPLVANLTDDNDDGVIDTRDTPDVVVVNTAGELVILDGKTGDEHLRISRAFSEATPALGDIDGDEEIDIVVVGVDRSLAAYHADGKPIWQTEPNVVTFTYSVAVALADLDHDGSPEIIAGERVWDQWSQLLWVAEPNDHGLYNSPVVADLDGDDDLEVIYGGAAYRHDGTPYYRNTDLSVIDQAQEPPGYFSAVADLDGDEVPEIVVNTTLGLFVLDNAGKTIDMAPHEQTGYPFPPAIADLDGDGTPEILISSGTAFTAYTADLETHWSMPVIDSSGIAAGTAFDFLGDGSAEAMYGDETMSWGFDGLDGHVIFMQPRASLTLFEYPSVADVDNDGSADILIVSSEIVGPQGFGLRVISDRDGRWVPARRILNQDSYHVTNVNEDGTIPRYEQPHWKLNNSFRAQAQINRAGALCLPEQ